MFGLWQNSYKLMLQSIIVFKMISFGSFHRPFSRQTMPLSIMPMSANMVVCNTARDNAMLQLRCNSPLINLLNLSYRVDKDDWAWLEQPDEDNTPPSEKVITNKTILTCGGRNKMAIVLQTKFSKSPSWVKGDELLFVPIAEMFTDERVIRP